MHGIPHLFSTSAHWQSTHPKSWRKESPVSHMKYVSLPLQISTSDYSDFTRTTQSVPGFFVQDVAGPERLPSTNVILRGRIFYAFIMHHHNLKTILFLDSSKIWTHRYLWRPMGEIRRKNSSTQQRFPYWNNIQIFSVYTTWTRLPYGTPFFSFSFFFFTIKKNISPTN